MYSTTMYGHCSLRQNVTSHFQSLKYHKKESELCRGGSNKKDDDECQQSSYILWKKAFSKGNGEQNVHTYFIK